MTKLDYRLRLMDNGNVKAAAACGVSSTTIQNYREGKYRPKYDIGVKLASFLGLTVEELFDEVDEKAFPPNLTEADKQQPVEA